LVPISPQAWRTWGDNVNAATYWDGGHGANEDPDQFMTWIGTVTGCCE
jgi:hypothetical protein